MNFPINTVVVHSCKGCGQLRNLRDFRHRCDPWQVYGQALLARAQQQAYYNARHKLNQAA